MPVEYVYIEAQGAHYPKKCSFCRHFRRVWDGKETANGIPLPNVHKSICDARSTYYGGYMQNPYILQEHGVLPYQQLHPDCNKFDWPKEWAGC